MWYSALLRLTVRVGLQPMLIWGDISTTRGAIRLQKDKGYMGLARISENRGQALRFVVELGVFLLQCDIGSIPIQSKLWGSHFGNSSNSIHATKHRTWLGLAIFNALCAFRKKMFSLIMIMPTVACGSFRLYRTATKSQSKGDIETSFVGTILKCGYRRLFNLN